MGTTTRVTLNDVKIANPGWFSTANKRFFGDRSYQVRYGRKSGKPYLVRATYAWSDMFGAPKRLHYAINPLDEKLDIRPLVDRFPERPGSTGFPDREDVTDWLREH